MCRIEYTLYDYKLSCHFPHLLKVKLLSQCPNNTYLSTDWSADSVDLTCGADGAFEKPSPFPNCEQRPTCQV